jgi:hypothetical protein
MITLQLQHTKGVETLEAAVVEVLAALMVIGHLLVVAEGLQIHSVSTLHVQLLCAVRHFKDCASVRPSVSTLQCFQLMQCICTRISQCYASAHI